MRKLVVIAIILCIIGCKEKIGSRRIAHAGGGYKGEAYTDSFEALNYNFHNGFRLFEIDLNWTVDNQLVCIHDWEESFNRFFGFTAEKRLTLEEFQFLVRTVSPYHLCTLQELNEWLEENPKARIVTDIKHNNLLGLELISKTMRDFESRIIPQIYQPEEYLKAKQIGFRNIIWTLYEFDGDNDAVISWVEKMEDLYAVTMPLQRVTTGLGRRLQERGIFTYTHTINMYSTLEFCKKNGIDNIYTDFLPPY